MQITHRLPDMFRFQPTDQYKLGVILVGLSLLAFALAAIPTTSIGLGLVGLLLFAIFIAPRMALSLPRSKFSVTFSDSLIFFTFLVYGGETAVAVAFIETFAGGLYLSRRGKLTGKWIVLFNASCASIATTGVFAVVTMFTRSFFDASRLSSDTRSLIVLLGVLAFTHFAFTSFLATGFLKFVKVRESVWNIWRKDCLATSISQITGAGLAGITFKLIHYADPLVIIVSATGIGILYFSYRQSIGEINSAFEQVEEAERAKAETERVRRVEVEEFADQLSVALAKEEQANKALRKSERDFAHAAMHDSLTGLANRKNFGDALRRLIAEYKLDPSNEFQVLFLDIRSFKNINDTLGHTIGD
ncbi:MAG TPA: GGDEF domain-containing protein, partial [Pyrinomonadaceae bacterium]